MMREYTIDDIAAELGVSKTTVSRAISGKGRISEATRKRILGKIEERGFRPSALAKGLAKSRTYNIGTLLPSTDMIRDLAFFRECLWGICDEAAENDYDVILTVGDEPGRLMRILENRKVDGMIATRSEEGQNILTVARERDMPVVIIGEAGDDGAVYVDNANALAAGEMTDRLIDLGAGRLALFGGDIRYAVTKSRARGFEDACRRRGVDEIRQFWDLLEERRVEDAVTAAYSDGVEAILCMDDGICRMAMEALARRGIRVPVHMRVACLYDSPMMRNMTPSVTSVHFDAAKLGRAACRQVINLIEGRDAESLDIPDFEIIMRDST